MAVLPTNSVADSPLRIDHVAVPGTGGLIGMTLCPGKALYSFPDVRPGGPRRDLDRDLQVICDWQTDALVTLMERFEIQQLVPDLPKRARQLGLHWLHLPIVDVWIPDEHFERTWQRAGAELRQILRGGGRVVLHCRGGLGRTGTIAGRLLVEFGVNPREAIRLVRAARPGTIQTLEQETYVLRCRP